jgi:hypothetical protein
MRQIRAVWCLTWTNARHPAPLLACPGDPARQLDDHDIMFYPGLGSYPRADHRLPLAPGSTLVLYTVSLVERRGERLDLRIDALADLLDQARDLPLNQLPGCLADHSAGTAPENDIAILAVRIPAADRGPQP